MIAPRSQVIDRRGLYFDASRPSDLSVLLNETSFTHTELARAASLRKLVNDRGVTKYHLGRRVDPARHRRDQHGRRAAA